MSDQALNDGTNEGAGAAKLKRKTLNAEELLEQYRQKRQERTGEQVKQKVEEDPNAKKFAKIKENPFYQIMHGEGSPEEKVQAYRNLVNAELSRTEEQNRAIREANEIYKEWLSVWGKSVIERLIGSAEKESTALLQRLMKNSQDAFQKFDNILGPYVRFLDAITILNQKKGAEITDIFEYIAQMDQEDSRFEAEKARKTEEIERLENNLRQSKIRLSVTKENSPTLMFWKKKDHQLNIQTQEATIQQAEEKVAKLKQERDSLKPVEDERFKDLKPHIREVKAFMELSSEESRQTRQALINEAQAYFKMSNEESAQVLEQLKGLRSDFHKAADMSGKMTRAFTIVHKAESLAIKDSAHLAQALGEQQDSEDEIQALESVKQKNMVDEHVKDLMDAQRLSRVTVLNLHDEGMTVDNLVNNNRRSIRRTKELNENGVRSIGVRLLTTINGLSETALYQAYETLQNTMKKTDQQARNARGQAAMKSALGEEAENEEMKAVIETMTASVGEYAKAQEIRRKALEQTVAIEKDLAEATKLFNSLSREAQGQVSKVIADHDFPEDADEQDQDQDQDQDRDREDQGQTVSRPATAFDELNI